MTEMPPQSSDDAARGSSLPAEMASRIWSGVALRLRQGAVLITPEHFLAAVEEEYVTLAGRPADSQTRRELQRLVSAVNTRHPETFVASGVRNGVSQAFNNGVRALAWSEARVQSRGVNTVLRFARRGTVRGLLEEVNVRVEHLDIIGCVQRTAGALRALAQGTPASASAPKSPPAVPPPRRSARASASAPEVLDAEVAAAVRSGEVAAEVALQRVQRQEERRSVLVQRGMASAVEHLQVYVAQGALTQAEAEQYRALRQVDERQKRGEIDAAEADRVRNSILQGGLRDALEHRVRDAVDQAVRYVQVFESMQKISPRADRALDFVVRHKDTVVAAQPSADGLASVVAELSADPSLLGELMHVVDRIDHEVRMISVRLPPYNHVASRSGIQRIANLTVEPAFVSELRTLRSDEISARLHSLEPAVRVRPAADMRCMISLIDHSTKRTPFRREVRLVRLARSIEEYYRSTNDVRQARHQAEGFIKTRLRRLFPEMGAEEASEIRQRGAQIIDAVEQRVLGERQAAERLGQEAEAEQQTAAPADQAGDADLQLTDEEAARGVLVAPVEVRLAGAYRGVPCKIMPDPDEPERYVIAVRDRTTGELMPRLRHNARRYVTRDSQGVWRTE